MDGATLDELQSPPIPDDEGERLESLAAFDILDTGPDADLDDIVALVAQICCVPIAAITFVDAERQWFKAKVGLELEETPRRIAFCAHTVMSHRPLIVPDARLDPRFAGNPLVVGSPHIRFYAGFPLLAEPGSAVGTLTVMDTVPRNLELQQLLALRVMSRQVVKWLELRRNIVQLQRLAAERDRSNQRLKRAHVALEQEIASKTQALDVASVEGARSERLYRTLWETTTDAVLIIDASSTIRFASPSCEQLFQYPPAELLGQPLSLLQPERLRDAHVEGMRRYLATHQRRVNWRAAAVAVLRKDGSEVPVEVSFSELDLDSQPHFVGFFRDVTERQRAEQRLFEEKERAQATLRAIGDGVVVIDESGRVTFMNPLAEQLTGWSATEAVGRSSDEVLPILEAEGEAAANYALAGIGPETQVALADKSLRLRQRNGELLAVEGSITGLRDREGRRAGAVVAFRDVSRWRQLTAQLTHQATHDSLTGLVNRGELERRVRRAIGDSHEQNVHSFLYLDLDQFKVVNDTCGHGAGDEMLRQLAEVMRPQLRARDTLARLGGDEFGILLEHCPPEQALQLAERLRSTVDEFPFAWGGHVFSVGVSIGHVSFGPRDMSLEEVLGKADEACYMAKELGRNRVHSFQPGDEELARRHVEMEWVQLLRKALREGRFVLYEQPIFNLRSSGEAARHVEILLRLRDEAGEMVPPMSFIPAAERYGLMPAIDRWVVGAVVASLGRRLRADPDSARSIVAINLSGGSLTDPQLPGYVRAQLLEHGVPGHCICFEITETSAIGNLANAVQLIEDLKAAGCLFSLDDFGSGMSSFTYLRRLPVNFLKIDGSFVRDIAHDAVDRAMVAAIHQIGHLMGLETIAEFVEDERILAELRSIGVDYGQGYGLARPTPFDLG